MCLGRKRACLLVKAANVLKPLLPPDRVDQVHTPTAREHENSPNPNIM
jgi:hypothetical protein